MSNELSSIRQIWTSHKWIAKVLLVFAVFLLMVIASCIFMNRTLNKKLLDHAEHTINDVQTYIAQTLAGPEVVINFIADNIQEMILRGESFESIKAYMAECSSPDFMEKINTFKYYSVYGFFDIFDEFFDGGGMNPPGNFLPRERPWYTAALNTDNKVVMLPVYLDVRWNTFVLGYSRRLLDHENRLLGVVSINVPLNSIDQFIATNHITENSYGFIVSEDLLVVSHPSKDLVGEVMGTSHADIAEVTELIKQGREVSLYKVKGHREVDSFIFSRKIGNGWYINYMVPEAEYYSDLYEMTVIISILGLLMACVLSIVLVRIDIARNRLDMKNRQKSSFLAVMSHEIRTPMNAIMGIAEYQLEENDETLPPNIQEAFDRIYYSGGLLLQIISDLLDLSKIEVGKLDIVTGRYELASLINEVVHLNKIRFDDKPIEFKLYVDENIPALLIGDELRIKQILNNLLSNAYKYTWKGEVKLSVTASVPAVTMAAGDELDVMLVLSVSDTGQGISSEDIKKLFDEYTRFNLNANRSTIGAGLGLSITQDLVSLMKGEILVKSEVGKGTTFTVHLPQKTEIIPEKGSFTMLGKKVVNNLYKLQFLNVTRMKKPPVLRENMPYGRVLIVDDVEMNLFVAKLLMRPYGLKIDTASSGYEAIDRVKGGDIYDVIFMDHMMPKMDGIEAVQNIRNLGYTSPIIALTANAVTGQADIFLSNGFDDFISKPIDIYVLNMILNKYIRDRNEERKEAKLREQEKEAESEAPRIPDMINMPGLNVEQGLEFFDGDTEDYVSALSSFVKNAPEAINKMRGVSTENLPDYAINAHSLKSISAWICAESIRKGAEDLEAMAKAGDASGVLERNETFLKEAETFLMELKALLKENLSK